MSLNFEALSGGRVDGACRLFFTCQYTAIDIRYEQSDLQVAYLHKLFPACVQVMKQVGPQKGLWFSTDACWFVNQGFIAIYYHMLRRNDLGLSTPAKLFRGNSVQADIKHDESNNSYHHWLSHKKLVGWSSFTIYLICYISQTVSLPQLMIKTLNYSLWLLFGLKKMLGGEANTQQVAFIVCSTIIKIKVHKRSKFPNTFQRTRQIIICCS
jgi:hypothetical protein